MAKTKKSEEKKVESKNIYKINFKYLDSVQEGEFESVYEGLKQMRPEVIKNRVVLNIEKNGRKYGRVIFAPHARRIFFNLNALAIISRNIERALP